MQLTNEYLRSAGAEPTLLFLDLPQHGEHPRLQCMVGLHLGKRVDHQSLLHHHNEALKQRQEYPRVHHLARMPVRLSQKTPSIASLCQSSRPSARSRFRQKIRTSPICSMEMPRREVLWGTALGRTVIAPLDKVERIRRQQRLPSGFRTGERQGLFMLAAEVPGIARVRKKARVRQIAFVQLGMNGAQALGHHRALFGFGIELDTRIVGIGRLATPALDAFGKQRLQLRVANLTISVICFLIDIYAPAATAACFRSWIQYS